MKEVRQDKENRENKEEVTYINLFCCKLAVGIFFTCIFILASASLTLVNRIAFLKYNFKFSFTILFLQQTFCCIFFTILGNTNEQFKSQSGEISFKDFLKLKYQYIFFSIVFIINNVIGIYANQLVVNTAMYLTLRKFLIVMNLLYDLFINKKTLPGHFIYCVILITLGTLLTGIDDFSADYVGYVIVFMYNTIGTIYVQISDKFKKRNGVSNLKLLIYCSYLAAPILLTFLFVSGEYNRLIKYIENAEHLGQLCGLLLFNCLLCSILNSTLFISNEKNSSLFTQLLGNCKDILISFSSLIILKDFKPTFKTIAGLLISTSGAILFSMKSLLESIIIGGGDEKTKKTQ